MKKRQYLAVDVAYTTPVKNTRACMHEYIYTNYNNLAKYLWYDKVFYL